MELRRLLNFSYIKINRKLFSSCCYVIVKWLDETDIKTDRKGIALVVADWTYLAQDRENLQAVESTVHKMGRFSWLTEDE
jgi:hypothetical protein